MTKPLSLVLLLATLALPAAADPAPAVPEPAQQSAMAMSCADLGKELDAHRGKLSIPGSHLEEARNAYTLKNCLSKSGPQRKARAPIGKDSDQCVAIDKQIAATYIGAGDAIKRHGLMSKRADMGCSAPAPHRPYRPRR